MLDLKTIRAQPEAARRAVEQKGGDVDIDALLALDEERRGVLGRVEELKARRNAESKRIAERKKAGEDAAEAVAAMKAVGEEIKGLDAREAEIEAALRERLLRIPNVPDESVPVGATEEDNREERRWGAPLEPDFALRDHQALGEGLGLLDLKAGALTSGSGFYFLRGAGARLERALIQFMLDLHVAEHGYEEVSSPYLVRPHCCLGTGQLPKFGDDMYSIERDDLYLIPTAEVPLTNLFREQRLTADALPLNVTGHSPCFRREAGSHGKETSGLQRLHQFHKVELVKLTHPDRSMDALETLTREAETVLQRLELHYRVVTLCTGDLGFASAKTYDLEVWAPAAGRFLEVSSCSNFLDFQARRADIRFRDADKKLRYVHTLNGSGLALPRLMIALLETHQQSDGSIRIPEALRAHFRADSIAG